MLRELAATWREVAADSAIRCVVLTGAGDRLFCGGMDMTQTIPVSQCLARGERVEPEEFDEPLVPRGPLAEGFRQREPLFERIFGSLLDW